MTSPLTFWMWLAVSAQESASLRLRKMAGVLLPSVSRRRGGRLGKRVSGGQIQPVPLFPGQIQRIELLKRTVRQPLLINQLQFSLPVSNMVANNPARCG